MTDEHRAALDIDECGVVQKNNAGFSCKTFSQHEVAIAMHGKATCAIAGKFCQCRYDFAVVRIGIVIADPVFEKIAEYIKRICVVCSAGEKP